MAAVPSAPPMGLVIAMGLGTVFVGLICIILICTVMGKIIRLFEKPTPAPAVRPAPEASAPAAESMTDKGELLAVISAVIAEEMGESVEAIRICSVKKIS